MPNYDIIGADEIIGADPDLDSLLASGDLVVAGAADAGAGSGNRNALRALAMKNAVGVVAKRPHKARIYSQGFGPTPIPAGATVNITVQPQVDFKGKRLVVPSDIAGAVLINDLKIGNISQLPSSNPLPGRAFTEFAVGMQQDFDTAQISQQMTLSVTNVSGAPISFTALINGIVVQ